MPSLTDHNQSGTECSAAGKLPDAEPRPSPIPLLPEGPRAASPWCAAGSRRIRSGPGAIVRPCSSLDRNRSTTLLRVILVLPAVSSTVPPHSTWTTARTQSSPSFRSKTDSPTGSLRPFTTERQCHAVRSPRMQRHRSLPTGVFPNTPKDLRRVHQLIHRPYRHPCSPPPTWQYFFHLDSHYRSTPWCRANRDQPPEILLRAPSPTNLWTSRPSPPKQQGNASLSTSVVHKNHPTHQCPR